MPDPGPASGICIPSAHHERVCGAGVPEPEDMPIRKALRSSALGRAEAWARGMVWWKISHIKRFEFPDTTVLTHLVLTMNF